MTTQQAETSMTGPSPVRRTRIQEKEELQYLNDRFLSYIEQVRQMKESNLRLEIELTSVKEQQRSDADALKALYESELADARNLIDETAKEKARQQIIASKHASHVEELEAELKALKDELEKYESRLMAAERSAASFDAQRKAALVEKSKLQKQVKDLEAELEETRSSLDAMKESLEVETLGKVDLQNNIQSLKEEIAFRKKVHDEELQALREKLSLSISTSGVVDTAVFAVQLESAIDELREKSELEIAQYKQEIDDAYKDKMAVLEAQSARDASTINKVNSDMRKTSSAFGEQSSEISRQIKENDRLVAALRLKEEEISRLRQLHSEDMSRLVAELRELRASYEAKIKDYEDLMDIRVQLDQEIATYRALLQEEESRLNLTPTPREKRTRSRTQVTAQQIKRPRLDPELTQKSTVSSTAAGYIQISDVDPLGNFVEIKNMSNQIESLGGFKLFHQVEGGEEVVFRFHHKSKLQGGASVTVWASKAPGATHNPPTDIIWRSQETWGASAQTTTKLASGSGEVVATFVQRSDTQTEERPAALEAIDSGARSFPHIPEITPGPSPPPTVRYQRQELQQVGDEHVFHQQGDPRAGRAERCRIS